MPLQAHLSYRSDDPHAVCLDFYLNTQNPGALGLAACSPQASHAQPAGTDAGSGDILTWLARGAAWKDVAVSVPYPQEFRDDVVRVARNREKDVTLAQIAKDFGVHEMTLSKWMHQAKVEDGEEPGVTRSESAENRELK
ncbi:hypothetical protein GCM10012287_10150 [Streptomyces daqingensis]|uniref:Transposase n=1 Tax=Streptomyces daqingensis TaxID=1472640 RepID=A0ABQ2LXZ2_9ACTN|nr:hypothetical protein GCM10012287_10150 [Streptomyces daqingensis]